jgi:hypothetical protein
MHFMFAPSSLTGASRYLKIGTQAMLLARPLCKSRRFGTVPLLADPKIAFLGIDAGTIACVTGAP